MVADKLPAMWGRETLTTAVSRNTISELNITAMANTHRFTSGGCSPAATMLLTDPGSARYPHQCNFLTEESSFQSEGGLAHYHFRDDRHPRAQRAVRIRLFLENDLDRHPLHDFDEVAGGVLGRQQAEPGGRRGGDRLHPAA